MDRLPAIITGALAALAVLSLTKAVLSALLISILGRQVGKALALAIEMAAGMALAVKFRSDPGFVMICLGWSAAVAQHLLSLTFRY
ncbi:hypothetical protein [Desulfotomaculum copahuensis]|uniref:Uncharacterized protein n=1 Tax=Desulfotomaculum copahuensis TaxID=1838280 RepID=A0A1B7LG38_9FIRM|nr:hypothetical protein [Desulfotomaculum copahuensis]OAT83693.1 hypothetical protein A6M21_07605 [Desulfotomaculum copahuensis]